jgi:hypothetical protein
MNKKWERNHGQMNGWKKKENCEYGNRWLMIEIFF